MLIVSTLSLFAASLIAGDRLVDQVEAAFLVQDVSERGAIARFPAAIPHSSTDAFRGGALLAADEKWDLVLFVSDGTPWPRGLKASLGRRVFLHSQPSASSSQLGFTSSSSHLRIRSQ